MNRQNALAALTLSSRRDRAASTYVAPHFFYGFNSDLCMVILYLDLPKKYRLKPLSKQSDDKYAWLLTK